MVVPGGPFEQRYRRMTPEEMAAKRHFQAECQERLRQQALRDNRRVMEPWRRGFYPLDDEPIVPLTPWVRRRVRLILWARRKLAG